MDDMDQESNISLIEPGVWPLRGPHFPSCWSRETRGASRDDDRSHGHVIRCVGAAKGEGRGAIQSDKVSLVIG